MSRNSDVTRKGRKGKTATLSRGATVCAVSASGKVKILRALARRLVGHRAAASHFPFLIKRLLTFSGFNVVKSILFGANMRERRKNFRVEWNSPAKIYDRNGRFAGSCTVSNFSNGGGKIVGLEPSTVPDEFILRISPHGHAHKCHVTWRSKDGLGVQFTDGAKGISEPAPARRRKSLSSAPV
jgi:hypothetical protein